MNIIDDRMLPRPWQNEKDARGDLLKSLSGKLIKGSEILYQQADTCFEIDPPNVNPTKPYSHDILVLTASKIITIKMTVFPSHSDGDWDNAGRLNFNTASAQLHKVHKVEYLQGEVRDPRVAYQEEDGLFAATAFLKGTENWAFGNYGLAPNKGNFQNRRIGLGRLSDIFEILH